MPTTVDIADAVVHELNNAGLTPAFTAERKMLPKYTLEEMADLRVVVVPRSIDITKLNRSSARFEIEIDIGVQQRLAKRPGSRVVRIGDHVRSAGGAKEKYVVNEW